MLKGKTKLYMLKISKSLKVKLLGAVIVVLFMMTMASPASASKRIFEQEKEIVIGEGGTHLTSVIDTNGIRHFVYLESHDGNETKYNIEGKNDTYDLKYGTYDLQNGQNGITTIYANVFAYHYTLKLDSNNGLHLAYIAGNRTLFYTYKSSSTSTWTNEQVTTPDPIPGDVNVTWPTVGIRASQPAIALNGLDEPHIVFTAAFNDHDNSLNHTDFSLQNIRTIYYAVKNSSGWQLFDILENSDRRDFETQLRVYPSHPGISVYESGSNQDVYVTWTNRFSLASETRLRLVNFKGQFPDGYPFRSSTIQYIERYGIHTEFRRVELYRINDSLVLFYGTTVQGGARVAYLDNRYTPFNVQEWDIFVLDSEREFNGVFYIDTQLSDDGYIFLTWSMHDDYSPTDYEYDVYMATFDPRDQGEDTELEDHFEFARLTLTDNIDHLYPTINLYNKTAEVAYIKHNSTHTTLQFSKEMPQITPESNSIIGFLFGLLLAGLFLGTSIIFIKKLPKPDIEEEILPHMINLKDSIETH